MGKKDIMENWWEKKDNMEKLWENKDNIGTFIGKEI